MKAMILAAGYGTRLRPLTYSMPKPMVEICNRPLIGYAVEGFIRAGVGEIIVNLHHLPESIERFLQDAYGSQCRFHISFEPEILGTGGGVRKVRPLLESDEAFYLVNGDTIQFPQYEKLVAARQEKDALAALTLRHPPENDRFTAVYFADGRINGFGKGSGEALMFSGSHLIGSRIFQYLPEKEFSGIVTEVYEPLIESGRETVAGIVDDGPWFDIGTPQRLISAAGSVLDMTMAGDIPIVPGSRLTGDCVIDETATVLGKVSRSSVGAGSVVKGEVRNSIIGRDCRITGNVVLESCVVGPGVEIRTPMEVRSAIICEEDPGVFREPGYRYERGLVIADF
ncbi:MAG TPA: sugar phosphate nucleotidyltransferase [Thermoanaerobaculia bacterium]|nr:sugar phosphate nucleotidyltransferase [Thermoanaerobaculia bacterium]